MKKKWRKNKWSRKYSHGINVKVQKTSWTTEKFYLLEDVTKELLKSTFIFFLTFIILNTTEYHNEEVLF